LINIGTFWAGLFCYFRYAFAISGMPDAVRRASDIGTITDENVERGKMNVIAQVRLLPKTKEAGK